MWLHGCDQVVSSLIRRSQVLWSATSQRYNQLPQAPLRVGTSGAVTVHTPHSVKSLGIVIDDTLSFSDHITACAGRRIVTCELCATSDSGFPITLLD
jgi:hypothetical protein